MGADSGLDGGVCEMSSSWHQTERLREGLNRERADRDELSGRVEGDLLRRHVDRDPEGVACVRCTIRNFGFFELATYTESGECSAERLSLESH